MRFGLQARFVAIVLLIAVIVFGGMYAIRSQQAAHARAVSSAVQAATQQLSDDQQQELVAQVEAVNHRYRVTLSLMLVAFAMMLAGIALLVSYGLVQPVLRLAEVARHIDAGNDAASTLDSQRSDEIGDLVRAFGSIGNALVAMRRRMDHDAPAPAPTPERADGTILLQHRARPATVQPRPAAEESAEPTLSPRDRERLLRMEDELREAWQRGEMSIVYQPIHSVADGSMRGAEALLRWQHPVDGAISPSVFVPIAERSDAIENLGRSMLVQACSDASLWPCGGTPEETPFLSVNVSARQLRGTQLFEDVVDALRRSNLSAARLHLELPVAAMRNDDHAVVAMIEQLRGLGVQIWLDAAGAGPIDQERLRQMPVDGVKVGRSPIAGSADSAEQAATAGALAATARALRMVAVAVGIEKLAQLDVLRAQGCELAQGFVLCRPVDTIEIGRRLLA